jgi:hypothetical protein
MSFKDTMEPIYLFSLYVASLVSWQALTLACAGIVVALFTTTWQPTAGGGLVSRRLTRTGWIALGLLLIAFGWFLYHQSEMLIDKACKETVGLNDPNPEAKRPADR